MVQYNSKQFRASAITAEFQVCLVEKRCRQGFLDTQNLLRYFFRLSGFCSKMKVLILNFQHKFLGKHLIRFQLRKITLSDPLVIW